MTTLISSAIIISPSGAEGVGRIAWHNLFIESGAVVSASSAATGYEALNGVDWKQYDWWKPTSTGVHWLQVTLSSAKPADYMAVFGHNLHSIGGSAKAQYSTDGISWTDASNEVMPATARTLFFEFDSVSAKYWRCLVTTLTGQSLIAGVMIGESMKFERDLTSGFAPATLSPITESKVPMSEGGVNLGASIVREGIKGTIALSNITPLWVREKWVPLINHLNLGRPCVFCWNAESYIDEAALIWKTRDIAPPSYQSVNFMQASLNFEGVI
jgi:hypothetical protein